MSDYIARRKRGEEPCLAGLEREGRPRPAERHRDHRELPPGLELREQQAKFFARNGINAVRLHSVGAWLGYARNADGSPQFNADRLEALDHWFAPLAAEGIYSDWSVFYDFPLADTDAYPAALRAELRPIAGGRSTYGFAPFRTEIQDAETRWIAALLAHRNPYTGTTYAESPALALVELRNEDSVFWHHPLNTLAAGVDWPQHTLALSTAWAAWLAAHYADDAALLAAWGPTWGGSRPGENEALLFVGNDSPQTDILVA